MGIVGYFNDRKSKGTIEGKRDEYFVLSRVGKGSSHFQLSNMFKAYLQNDTQAVDGDIVTIGSDAYFVVALRRSATGTVLCQLYKTNAVVDIVRIQRHYTNKMHDYDEEIPLYSNQVSMYEDINGKMQMYDIGLKSTSTRRFMLPILDIELLDRIKLNGELMQVDVINTSAFSGLISVQTSADTRTAQATP